MIWETIRSHGGQVEMFRRSIARGRLSHAYLFVGPEGIGKSLFARALAQCLFCTERADEEFDACGRCPACRQMRAGSHPDFHAVGCPEGKRELPLELFIGDREHRGRTGLCYELSLRPMEADRRVALIDDAHLLNAESSNALLKTLEEPPAGSVLILIATDPDALLPTIRSRCQQVRFAPLRERDLSELLIELGQIEDRGEAESLAALSEGSLTVAGQLLDPALRRLRTILYDHLAQGDPNSAAVARDVLARLDEIGGDAPAQRQAASWLIRFCIEFYRRAVWALSGRQGSGAVEQVDLFVKNIGPASPDVLELLADLIERAALAESQIDRMAPPPLCLEGLFHDVGRMTREHLAQAAGHRL